nr:very short patch repair endonuclease [Lysobacter gummosus]
MSQETRSRVMSRIRGRDTKPEITVRRYLHCRGLRYTLHDRKLPGKPDLVFRTRKVAIFVHGCFWHGHEGCSTWKVPQSRTDYWLAKIKGNRERDARTIHLLEEQGWLVLVVWACQINDRNLEQLHKTIISRSKAY